MEYKLYGSSKIPKDKAATFNFKPFETDDLKEVVKFINTHSVIPCSVEDGHRLKNNVKGIYPWIRLDIDVKGEARAIDKALKGIQYIKKPSTSHLKHPYKWHYFIPIKNVSQNYDAYKLQYFKFLAEFKINIKDKSLASVVQNTNPMGEEGIHLTELHKGKIWAAPDVVVPARKEYAEKHSDISKGEIKRKLKKISPDLSYTNWLRVGLALFDWCPKKGFKLFDKWSKKSDSYDGTTSDKWDDFYKNASGDVSVGTLMTMGKDGEHVERPPEDEFACEGEVESKGEGFSLDVMPHMLSASLIQKRGSQLSLFDGIVTQQMHTFIYGAAGSNKTTLMAWIALKILKENVNMKCHFWSFDASQNHEQSIYDYANKVLPGEDRMLISVESTPEDYYNYYNEALERKEDMRYILIIVDTFKFISSNINDKNANKKALHYIKRLIGLGATVVSLGHTNKDGVKQSGTAEIEQDSEGILRIDRVVDEFSGEVALTVSPAGRVRLSNPRDTTFKSYPKGTGYDYLYSALDTMVISDEVIDIASSVDKDEGDEHRFKKRKINDQPMIDDIRFVIESLTEDKKTEPIQNIIKQIAKIEYSIGGTKVDRLLREYADVEWTWKPYQNKNGGRRTKIYKLKGGK